MGKLLTLLHIIYALAHFSLRKFREVFMTHKPIQIKNLELSFPHKTCFADFTYQIPYGSRIAIIGRNGGGKSSLLRAIARDIEHCSGEINVSDDMVCGYVPQVISDRNELSGGQRFNAALTDALSKNPNVLLLDEPTNHLDQRNRKSLIRMLQNYPGTLIIVSHDRELLRTCVDTIWHIDNCKVTVFSGEYDRYIRQRNLERVSIEKEISHLSKERRDMHDKLMKEQQRAANSKTKGEKKVQNRKWTKMTGDLKAMRAEKSQGKKLQDIDVRKSELADALQNMRMSEIIVPKFSIEGCSMLGKTLVQIANGSIGYKSYSLQSNINLSVKGGDRVAIMGDNGSGKTTLIKAILGDASVYKMGDWYVVNRENIGYLDQHYHTLDMNKSVFQSISDIVPHWSHNDVRRHLNDFLFRKNEEVNTLVNQLSGGEKARLSLAQIAARTPQLLILDEITNNLDIETNDHISQVLKEYPGAMLIISHDPLFLREIGITNEIQLNPATC